MQNEPQQIDVSPKMIVLSLVKEDSPDLEAALSRKESATHDISQKEAIPAINGNEAEQSDFVPKLIALPVIQEEDPINKPVVKVNQIIKNEESVQKEIKESDKKAGFERRDTADTATIEIPSSAAKPTENNNDNGILEGLRARFIRKVLLILLAQLVLTSLMVGMIFIPDTQYKKGIKNTPIIALVTVIVSILSLMILICNRKNLKRVPWNYILLFTFTSSASYSLTYLASYTESAVVLIAAVTLVLVIVGATTVAWNAKNNFSILVYVLSQLLPIALVVLVVGVAFSGYIVQAAISAGIALLFSAYLTYDIQRLIGNFEDKYTLDDYILAALDIYIDVYIIFVELLKLIQNVVQN